MSGYFVWTHFNSVLLEVIVHRHNGALRENNGALREHNGAARENNGAAQA